jgi:O-antigen/teichoic acid export membrane protein
MSLPFLYRIGLGGFKSLTAARVKQQLVTGWRGFLFTLAERISMILPVPLVEHFAGYAAAGQFSVAEKFVTATRTGFRVVIDTLLPRVAYYAAHDPTKGISLIRRSFLTLGGGALISLSLFFIAPYLIITFFGPDFSPATSIVREMAILPLILNANICLSTLYMFNYGHERAWTILTVGSLCCLILVTFVSYIFGNDATTAVVLGMIAKETAIFLVSAAFFIRFSQIKAAGRSVPATGRDASLTRSNSARSFWGIICAIPKHPWSSATICPPSWSVGETTTRSTSAPYSPSSSGIGDSG